MKQYRIYFIGGETLLVNEEEMSLIWRAFNEVLTGENLRGFEQEEKSIFINKENITHILSENLGESKVVTPPSPAELRDEETREQANAPITLDDQLANEEVGK